MTKHPSGKKTNTKTSNSLTKQKRDDIENPGELMDRIIKLNEDNHLKLIEAASKIGHMTEVLKAGKNHLERMSNNVISDSSNAELYNQSIEVAKSLESMMISGQNDINKVSRYVNNASGSAVAQYAATCSSEIFTASIYDFPLKPDMVSQFPAYFTPNQHELFLAKLERLNHDLAITYHEMWQSLFGTTADPERSALYLIRQAADQLFSTIAPDVEVRKSKYFTQKDGDKTDQVFREERYQYAANKLIIDSSVREIIISTNKAMKLTYDSLNRAHDRGEINRDKAKAAILQMSVLLENWINAID